MRKIFFIAAVVAAVATATVHDDFQHFKVKYNKVYASAAEEARAKSTFSHNLARIAEARRANPHATFGITRFSDLTAEQFRARTARASAPKASPNAARLSAPLNMAVPSELNWVTRGAVTPVQDQGDCGNDYVFSAIGNIEGVNFVQNNVLTPLSVEEVTDCDTLDQGCNGGFMTNVYHWLISKQGGNIMTAASWPWNNGQSNCTYVGKTVGATVTGYQSIVQSESALQTSTANYGPIAVAVDAVSWQFYEGGVLTNCSASQIDHGTLVVGYNDVANPPYWILKNTWGTEWGMNGYIWLQKGVDACGITSDASTAFVQKYI